MSERIYNTGICELMSGSIMMWVFFYLYGASSKLLIDASSLGTTTEEATLVAVSVILFLTLCGFLITGVLLVRYGLVTFIYFIIDVYNAQYEDWL